MKNIHTVGCVTEARTFINNNLYIILGTVGGLLVFQILAVILSACLAVGVRREKALKRSLKKSEYQPRNLKAQ